MTTLVFKNKQFKIFVFSVIFYFLLVFPVAAQVDMSGADTAYTYSSTKCNNPDTCLGLCACQLVTYTQTEPFQWTFFNEVPKTTVYKETLSRDGGATTLEYSVSVQFNKQSCSIQFEGATSADISLLNKSPADSYRYKIDNEKSYCVGQKAFCCCDESASKTDYVNGKPVLSNCKRTVDFKIDKQSEFANVAPNENGNNTNNWQGAALGICPAGKKAYKDPESGGCESLNTPTAVIANSPKEAGQMALADSLNKLKSEASGLNHLSFANIPTLIGQIIKFFTLGLGALSLLFYIYAGVLWMTSAGNSERVLQAKNIFLWTTLGLVAVFGSYIVVSEVIKFISLGGTI